MSTKYGKRKIDGLTKHQRYFLRYRKRPPRKLLSQEEKEERYRKNKEKSKEKNRARRLMVLNYYGGQPPRCQCCKESTIQFLSVDHIKGGGNQHRKEIFKRSDGRGGNIYHWIIKNNFPSGFQILCHNCNMSKGFYGVCPHNML